MLILILKNSNIGHTFNRNASTGTVQTYSPDKRTNRLTGDEVKVNCRITLCSGKGNGIQLLQATELQVSHLNTFRNKLPHFLFSNNAIVSQLNLLFDLFFWEGRRNAVSHLLMPQGIDWIKTSSLSGREETKNDTHRSGKEKGNDHDARIEDKGNIQHVG